jgi:excisionase family DNA binding protein
MPDEPMLKVRDVAERLNVPDETVRRWIRSGRMNAIMLGGTKTGYRIPESEIERILRGEQ